jgi:hypothetical protein
MPDADESNISKLIKPLVMGETHAGQSTENPGETV